MDGSFLLKGSRFDDLKLKKYHETVDPKSPEIDLLAPSGSAYPYFAEFGWSAAGAKIALPNDQTPWQLKNGTVLSPGKPVTLVWDNGQGLVFTRTIAVDEQYMFTVTDSVENKSGAKTVLYPYALVVRDGVPTHSTSYLLHEGFVGVANDKLKDPTYDDFKKDGTPPETFDSTGGWVGITDKYWMAAVVPPQDEKYNGAFRATPYGGTKSYQANYSLSGRTLAPGQTITATQRLFAGAKVVDTLRAYERSLGIQRFDLAVDWGWFIFLTQPLFWLLDKLNRYLGNFGLAIIMATVVIRLLLFPLANASFKSMGKMKKVQPEMERIKKLYADDKVRQQQEMMELYKREKVNPVTGCLPMMVQIPDPLVVLQGDVRHHRDVSRAILRLDQGSVRAGPDHVPQSVRPAALHRASDVARHSGPGRVSAPCRRLADPDGHDAMGSVQDESRAARSDAGEDLRADAGDDDLHVRRILVGSGDLLHMEQPALHGPTRLHDEDAKAFRFTCSRICARRRSS